MYSIFQQIIITSEYCLKRVGNTERLFKFKERQESSFYFVVKHLLLSFCFVFFHVCGRIAFYIFTPNNPIGPRVSCVYNKKKFLGISKGAHVDEQQRLVQSIQYTVCTESFALQLLQETVQGSKTFELRPHVLRTLFASNVSLFDNQMCQV
jgi:hypothetical protein